MSTKDLRQSVLVQRLLESHWKMLVAEQLGHQSSEVALRAVVAATVAEIVREDPSFTFDQLLKRPDR